jgi:hypothetical protein
LLKKNGPEVVRYFRAGANHFKGDLQMSSLAQTWIPGFGPREDEGPAAAMASIPPDPSTPPANSAAAAIAHCRQADGFSSLRKPRPSALADSDWESLADTFADFIGSLSRKPARRSARKGGAA